MPSRVNRGVRLDHVDVNWTRSVHSTAASTNALKRTRAATGNHGRERRSVGECRDVRVGLPESSSMISVHIVGDEELSTSDHRVCDDQLPARVWRKKNTVALNTYPHNIYTYNAKDNPTHSSTIKREQR